MLYPFSLTLDLYIQAESFEEAKKLAEAYVQDASLDTTDYPEIVQDVLEDCAKIIDNEVKSIGMWMWGDVKGYVLEKKVAFTKKYKDESREDEDCEEWEEVDSCWGCYEETDELIKEVMIENGLEE